MTAPKSKTSESSSGTFEYPHVPLSFKERKRLSDTLFYLSRDIPSLTSDVANLLKVAREKDEWDLAISELLTQTIVGLYCREGDHRLDGLRTYMLSLGISC